MKKLLLLLLLLSTTVYAQKDNNNKMLDTLYLKDGTTITGVIKRNLNSPSKIKMCKGNSREKTGKCIKYNPTEIDSFSKFYHRLIKAGGVLGFGKKEYKKGYDKYYSISFKNYTVYGRKSYSGNNFDFYLNSYTDYQTLRNRIYVTNKNSYNAKGWFKPGNINEDIRNAKIVFTKCEKKLEKFRKSKNKKEKGIMEFIDENCE